jgi:hypothetical protein
MKIWLKPINGKDIIVLQLKQESIHGRTAKAGVIHGIKAGGNYK